MHATLGQWPPTATGRPIRGTFYPGADPGERSSLGAALPKLLAMLVAMAVVRTVVAKAHGHAGASGRSRRREAIAALHRELHARDAAEEVTA